MANNDWCTCNSCIPLDQPMQCRCCQEVPNCRCFFNDDIVCITRHKDFGRICLQKVVLGTALVARLEMRGRRARLPEELDSYVSDRRNQGEPGILIYDSHKSHDSIPIIKHARADNIILFVLPAQTSHFLQPLDVGVFSPMKACYNGACSRYLREHPGKIITRYNLTHLISEAYLHTVTQSNLQAGFRATGPRRHRREKLLILHVHPRSHY